MRNAAHLSLYFLLLISWGCEHDSLTNFGGDISVNVEKDVYLLDSGQKPTVTLRNDSRRDVYFLMGSYVGFEQFKNGKWINFTEWFVVDGNIPYWSLAPGKSITQDLSFRYFHSEEIPGTYRFQFLVYMDKNLRIPFPLNQRISRPFKVVK